jgi:redox-sensitive bicupin YhaK (pirin superfamily)
MGIFEIRRADTRAHTQVEWLDSRHSFNFGPHRMPNNDRHGLLLVLNDDRVAPGGGFGEHGHADMEIVTYVLSGALEHVDSLGTRGVIRPGEVQRMSAGTGIRHAEMNASRDEPVHFLQMWVRPDTNGVTPSYEQVDVSAALGSGTLVPVASGRGHAGAVRLHQRDAVMWAGRLAPHAEFELPDARHVHLFVARGSVVLDGEPFEVGDALRGTDLGPQHGVAGPISDPDGIAAEIIVWETT